METNKLESEKKTRQIDFSEKIDDKINSITLIFTFFIIGILLLLIPDYFENTYVSTGVRIVFIFFGFIGLIAEITNFRIDDAIKGHRDFLGGLVVTGICFIAYWFINDIVFKIFIFIIFFFGIYFLISGLLKIIYSLYLLKKENEKTKGQVVIDIFMLFTKIASFILIVIQIIKAITQI